LPLPLRLDLDVAFHVSQGLDRETLGILIALCQEGVNPDALAEVVKYLRKEGQKEEKDTQ
jgi:Mitotic-spindle organizing gamma-tubulin ring associated